MPLQIVEVARPASDPNRQQQASFLAMACMTHVRSIGARRILQDDAAHPDDVELSSAMEAALRCTTNRLPVLLVCNPHVAVWQLFFDTFHRDYSARRFLIFQSRIERSELLRPLDIQRAALRRIEDAAPQEKHLVELTQEERFMLLAHIEDLTTGKELKACCVAFGLPPSGDPKFILRARLRDCVNGKLGPSKKRRLS